MLRWIGCIMVVALLLAVTTVAESQKGKKKGKRKLPVGTWVKSTSEGNLQFSIRPRALVFRMSSSDGKLTVHADIGFAKSNHFFGRISKVSREIPDGPTAGMLFSFQYKLDGKTMVLSNMTGKNSEDAKELIQGTYKLKAK